MNPTKQCKISQKNYGQAKGGRAVAPSPPPLKYATGPASNTILGSLIPSNSLPSIENLSLSEEDDACEPCLEGNCV